MRERLHRIPSTALALYIAVVDVTVWLGALPFEFYCRSLVAHEHPSTLLLLALLAANLLLLALIVTASIATLELVRRGFTRPAPVFVLRSLRARSKRFVR